MAKPGRPKGSKNKVVGSIPRAKKAPAKPNGQGALQAEREMPDEGGAVEALRILADLNDRVKVLEVAEVKAKGVYADAKAEREGAQQALGEKLWQLTHAADLPLFNPAQAEADLQQIQAAAVEGESATVLEDGVEAATVPPLTLPTDEAADDTPF